MGAYTKQDLIEAGIPVTDWRSIYVATALVFIGSVQYNLYFSALWPYMQQTDVDITESFFGLTVSLYSLGQIMSSPIFGYWSNCIRAIRAPLSCGIFLMFIGNLFYLAIELVPWIPARYMLLVGRFLNGAGSGNVALLRTYAATAATSSDTSRSIVLITLGQLIFTPLSHPGYTIIGPLHINLYTGPGYLATLMCVFGAFLIYFFFNESYAGIANELPPEPEEASLKPANKPTLPKYDVLAICLCYATRFTEMFVRTNMETLGSAFAIMMFKFSEKDAITYSSTAQGAIGIITFIVYILYIVFDANKHIQLRKGTIVAVAILLGFHLVTFAWPFLPPIEPFYAATGATAAAAGANASKVVGCNATRFAWCETLTYVNPLLFYITYATFIGLAFPILTVAVNTLFSQLLGPRRQGTQQGLLQVSAGLARMVGPVAGSFLYTNNGPRFVWIMEIGVCATTLGAWTVFWKRMVPLRVPTLLERRLTRGQSIMRVNPRINIGARLSQGRLPW